MVAKRDVPLATRIEEAIKKNESLESLSVDGIKRDIARARITQQKGISTRLAKTSAVKRGKGKDTPTKPSSGAGKPVSVRAATKKTSAGKSGKARSQSSTKKTSAGKSGNASSQSKGKSVKKSVNVNVKVKVSKVSAASPSKRSSKISVVGFRGRSSSSSSEKS